MSLLGKKPSWPHGTHIIATYHNRWVSTDMGGQEAPITPKDSVTAMLATMKQLSDRDQGAFMHQDKQPLAW